MGWKQMLSRLGRRDRSNRKARRHRGGSQSSRLQLEALEERALFTVGCLSPNNIISVSDAPRIVEGDSGTKSAVFSISLARPCRLPASVSYSTVDGSASAGSDYVATSGRVTFNPGVSRINVPVTILSDRVPEFDESFGLRLSGVSSGTLGRSQGTATIANDDRPTASINDVTVYEGDSGKTLANFTVTLSGPTSSTVTIELASQDGTAMGTDYLLTRNRLTFAPGDPLSKTATVEVNGDTKCETDETYQVRITRATNAIIGKGVGNGVIRDDVDVFVSIDDGSVVEGNSGTKVTPLRVKLSCPAPTTVTVNYTTNNSSALAGSDFESANGTIVFSPGESTKTVSIVTFGDDYGEPNEIALVDLFGPTNSRIGDGRGQVVITNDDPLPEFTVSDTTIVEGNGGNAMARFTISLVAGKVPDTGLRLAYRTENGTAVAGEDYTTANGIVTFSQTDTVKYVDVHVTGDVMVEPSETLLLNIAGGLGSSVIRDAQGVATITNDDAPLAGSKPIAVRTNVERGGLDWYFDLNGYGGVHEQLKLFGLVGDTPVVGDWNGDGVLDMGVVRANPVRGGLDWYLDLNGDGYLAESVVFFGLLGDQPVVGDWNGDGRDDLGVVRTNAQRGGLDWYLDLDNRGGAAERVAFFGLLGDTPVVGDWTGDGRSDFGVVRENAARGGIDWLLDLDNAGQAAERTVRFGLPGDTPLVGDWNNDGKDDVGIARTRGEFIDLYFDLLGDGDYAEKIVQFGRTGDRLLAGNR